MVRVLFCVSQRDYFCQTSALTRVIADELEAWRLRRVMPQVLGLGTESINGNDVDSSTYWRG